MPPQTPLQKKVRGHLTRAIGVCNEWCRAWRFYDRLLPTAFLFGVLCFLLYFITIAPPSDFPGTPLFKIEKGDSVQTIAEKLKEQHLIRSIYFFKLAARAYGTAEHAVEGEYFFPSAQSTVTIAKRIARGDFELVPVRVTVPEGTNTFEMADLFERKIPDFNKEAFLQYAQSKEGYLFPDTYFFLPGEDPLEVIATMESNFTVHTKDPALAAALQKFGKPLADVVVMASLIEKEAAVFHDRQMIAGILWKRISLNMPLQVDAVFPYIIGKNTFELTHQDLRAESPYNTYTNRGLPPGAITNPGAESLLAAATPIASEYLFYLSDLHSQFHYSTTYAQHLLNQKKYLK